VKAWQEPSTSWQIGAMASLQRVSHPLRLNLPTTETEKKGLMRPIGAIRTDDEDVYCV